MNRILLTLICAVGASLASFAQPNTSAPDDPNGPKMTFVTEHYAFDTITQGTVVKREFQFTNLGKAPLIISEVIVGCGCTVIDFPKEPIPPGKSGVIFVQFNSANKMGPQDKTATVKSNSNTGDIVLHLTGTVIAAKTAPTPGTPDPARGNPPVNH